jgi:site-specific DNA-methyltransferase (adenine-specific)
MTPKKAQLILKAMKYCNESERKDFILNYVNMNKMELNKIYNEDCMVTMSRIPDNSIDLTITSPPYNLGAKHHTGNNVFDAYDEYKDDMPESEYQDAQIKVLNELFRITKSGGSLMYNHKNRIKNGKQITPYEWILKTEWTIKQEVVWFNRSQNFDKCRFYPMTERIYWLSKGVDTQFVNTINQHDLLKDTAEGTDKEHKRAFPIKLAKRLLMCFPDSKIVYDPYCGSSTTAIACIDEKKNYIGSEISKNYYEYSVKRINKHLQQQTLF